MIDSEALRRLIDLEQGLIGTFTDVTLALTSVATTVSRRGVSVNSVVIPIPTNAAAKNEGIPAVTVSRDQFVLSGHSSSGTSRTYRCIHFTNSAL